MKTPHILIMSALALTTLSLAEPIAAKCETNDAFKNASCDVCYTETYAATAGTSGWSSAIESMTIPWKHGGGELAEFVLQSAQTLPEIIPSEGVTITPDKAEDIWEYHTDMVWIGEESGSKEDFITKDESRRMYTLKTGAKLTATGKKTTDNILVKSVIKYDNVDIITNHTDSSASRSVCVLGTFGTTPAGTTVAAPVAPAPVAAPAPAETSTDADADKEVTETLNAAGPEETAEITAEQTETKAGAGAWVFMILAIMFASAWNAYKKAYQK